MKKCRSSDNSLVQQTACHIFGTWSCSYGFTFSGSQASLMGFVNAVLRRNGVLNVGFVCDIP